MTPPPPSSRRPAPTNIQRAIQEGYPSEGSAPREAIEDEPSVPIHMGHHEAVVFRLQKLEANDIELARGLGDVRTNVAVIGAELQSLVSYAAKADAREERAEESRVANERAERAARVAAEAQVAAAALAAEAAKVTAKATDRSSDVALATARMTSREKIYLAVLGVVGAAVTGYFALSHIALK